MAEPRASHPILIGKFKEWNGEKLERLNKYQKLFYIAAFGCNLLELSLKPRSLGCVLEKQGDFFSSHDELVLFGGEDGERYTHPDEIRLHVEMWRFFDTRHASGEGMETLLRLLAESLQDEAHRTAIMCGEKPECLNKRHKLLWIVAICCHRMSRISGNAKPSVNAAALGDALEKQAYIENACDEKLAVFFWEEDRKYAHSDQISVPAEMRRFPDLRNLSDEDGERLLRSLAESLQDGEDQQTESSD